MGHIVGYEFSCTDNAKLREILRSAPFFSEYIAENDLYNYRGEANRTSGESMPDAYVRPENAGIEFCAYGERSVIVAVADFLEAELGKHFGPVRQVL